MSVTTDDAVFSAVIRWLNQVTDLKVVRAYPADEQTAPYLMLNLLTSRTVRDHEQLTEYIETDIVDPESGFNEIEAQPVIETEWFFSLNAYGENAMDMLRPIIAARTLMQVTEPLYPELILHSMSARRHLPEFVNKEWQDRAQIDLHVRGIVQDGFVIDVIDAIETTIVTTDIGT